MTKREHCQIEGGDTWRNSAFQKLLGHKDIKTTTNPVLSIGET
jgi:integrase